MPKHTLPSLLAIILLSLSHAAGAHLLVEQSANSVSALQVAFVGMSALIFGTLCFFLYHLNNRLKKNIRTHEATEHMMTKLSSAITNSGASVIITNESGCIEYVNQKFCKSTGYLHHELIGKSLDILTPRDVSEGHQVLNSGCLEKSWEGEVLCGSKDQNAFWCALTVSAVYDKDKQISNYVISAIDISALKAANQKMETLALFDSLTGLANRRLFTDRLNVSILNAQRHNKITALFILDLDQFKRINDTLGHQAGDQLLLIVAERLKACVREQDTVARLGGDEFTILLNDITELDRIAAIAENVLASLKKPIKLGKHEVIVSTSIGITISPEDSTCTETLMKNADLALYMAKDNGRDRYHFFTEDLNVRANQLLQIESELRQAIVNEDFYLHYQPQINLKTGEIASVEALIRWRHPERGDIPPSEFIPVAEDTGLIVQIGEWVMRNACKEIQTLYERTGKKLRVAVNLSPRQFNDMNLVDTVTDAILTSRLPAENLEIEVTESMLMHDIDTVIDQLNRIKSTGSTITIDDFGSGYSSLSYLRSLPVDILKIDQEFVRDIPEDLSAMEIASAVIAVAHKLNLKVVAEGVENIDQRDFLVINRCDYAQGYFFSRPLSYEGLYEFFLEEKQAVSA